MRNLINTLIICPSLLLLASFTNTGIRTEPETYTVSTQQTYKEFIQDAYNFYKRNGMKIPDHYYEILGIEDPTTPAWVKAPAVEPPPEVRLRDQIPMWIRKGQLMKESSSYYNADGTIKYVNRTRGGNNHKRGAIGPFQVLRIAWDHMRKENPEFFKGKSYSDMQTNLKLNEDVAAMYLLYIYNGRGNNNWNTTIMLYNRGPWGEIDADAREYLKKVKYYGTKNDK